MDLLIILLVVLLLCGSVGYGNFGGNASFGAGPGNIVGVILAVVLIVLVLRLPHVAV